MTNGLISSQLEDLLVEPQEDLNVEIKTWLDPTNSEDKARFAKAMIALANHGGGFLIIGFKENENVFEPDDENRPENLNKFSTDRINSIVHRFAEPNFQCHVKVVTSPENSQEFPIIQIPGGHKRPIRSKRDGLGNTIIQQNLYYIRHPGPRSEPPTDAKDWDALISRCIVNARDELINQIQSLIMGVYIPSQENEDEIGPVEESKIKLEQWFDESFHIWTEKIAALPEDHYARLGHGFYAIGYRLIGNYDQINGSALLETLRQTYQEARRTGWPPFWLPASPESAPYLNGQNIECFLKDNVQQDSAHSDFWRASPKGEMFLIRGFQEDGREDSGIRQGTIFDITLPTWRIAEILLHAFTLPKYFNCQNASIHFIVKYVGLRDRKLVPFANSRWDVMEGYASRTDEYQETIYGKVEDLENNLKKYVFEILYPMYQLFDFYELSPNLVSTELDRMLNRLL